MLEFSKIKMYQLVQAELEDRQMGLLFGGSTNCSCTCVGGALQWDGYNMVMLGSGGGSYDDLCACACACAPGSASTNI